MFVSVNLKITLSQIFDYVVVSSQCHAGISILGVTGLKPQLKTFNQNQNLCQLN